MVPATFPAGAARKVGLSISHPGHELRLITWVERARPVVFELTTGSRNGDDRTRSAASRTLLNSLGARPGGIFGDHLDREVYAWIMTGETQRFLDLADALADAFVHEQLDLVVTDSWQMHNVVHDLWHLVTRAAAAQASRRLARPVLCLDFPVVPRAAASRACGAVVERITLGDEEVARKLALARRMPDMAGEVADVLRTGGLAFIASETLHVPRSLNDLAPRSGEAPLYEQHGLERQAAGRYAEVLRWTHAAPIAAALWAQVDDQRQAA
jgi:hypothetical protein